jgi:hypothetical protein
MLERLAVYATLGVLLDVQGMNWTAWEFWCFLALFCVVDYLGRKDGFEQGLDAANDVLELSNSILEQAREHVDRHTTTLEAERKALEDTLNNVKHKDTL